MMRFARINVIDEMSQRRVSGTIVLPYPIALLECVLSTMNFTLGGRLRYDLEKVSQDQFNPALFEQYLKLKQGEITTDQYQEAVWSSKSLRPVNLGAES